MKIQLSLQFLLKPRKFDQGNISNKQSESISILNLIQAEFAPFLSVLSVSDI